MSPKRIFLLVPALAWLSACKNDPVFPIEPEIAFVSATPTEAKQFEDEITLTIHYQDGDGDLGNLEEGDATHNLFVVDPRPEIPDSLRALGYALPNLTPKTRRPSIQGQISVTLQAPPQSNWFVPGSTNNEVAYEIYLVDRAGHRSNTTVSVPITVLP